MNRRNFFSSIALIAGAASISPTIFIPKFEPVKWNRAALDVGFYPNNHLGAWVLIQGTDQFGNIVTERHYLNSDGGYF